MMGPRLRELVAHLLDLAASNRGDMSGSRSLMEAARFLDIEGGSAHRLAREAYGFVPMSGPVWSLRDPSAELADAALIVREGWSQGDELEDWT